MTLSPPAAASQGQRYDPQLEFFDMTSGSLVNPAAVQLDITYGSEAPLVPDSAGPFNWDGISTTPAPGTVWQTGTGTFEAWWDVPSNQAGGAYVATWTVQYGADDYLVTENFPVQQLPYAPVYPGDLGFWTGSITYQPPWSSTALSIPLGGADANGTTYILQKVTGWDGVPTAVGQVIQRSADHGGYATAQYYGPRIITLTVMASAATQALRDQARDLVHQAVPFSDLATFVYGEPVPKQAYVRLNATAGITENPITLTDVIFTIPLVAPDPRKYSTVPQSQSSVTAPAPVTPLSLPFSSGFPVTFPANVPPGTQGVICQNQGTFETRPLITVTGPIAAPSIINGSTGQAVTFSGLTLPAGQVLTLDMDARQAYNGGVFTAADPSSSWFVLNPGQTLIYVNGSNSGGSVLAVQFSSAWI